MKGTDDDGISKEEVRSNQSIKTRDDDAIEVQFTGWYRLIFNGSITRKLEE